MSTRARPRIRAIARRTLATAAAVAVFIGGSASAFAACPSFPVSGLIKDRWDASGGCARGFGDAVSPERRDLSSGGRYQDFELGQIVVYDRWPTDVAASMPKFVVSAFLSGDDVHVQWGDTNPFKYDFFNVIWDKDGDKENGHDPHQNDAPITGNTIGGSFAFNPKAIGSGIYSIRVEGCDKKGLLGSKCKQGWSYPVSIDYDQVELSIRWQGSHFYVVNDPITDPASHIQVVSTQGTSGSTAPTWNDSGGTTTDGTVTWTDRGLAGPLATPSQPPYRGLLLDLQDGPILQPNRVREAFENAVFKPRCNANALLDTDGDHEGELNPDALLPMLQKVRDWNVKCQNLPPTIYNQIKLQAFVNDKIRQAKVASSPGTDAAFAHRLVGAILGIAIAVLLLLIFLGLPSTAMQFLVLFLGGAVGGVIGFLLCVQHGDYDMRLAGILQARYQYKDLLDSSTKEYILKNLLTVSGEAKKRREYFWACAIPTIVKETENHILMTESARYLTNQLLASDYRSRGQPVPNEFNNDSNGMTDWFLGHLQSFLQNDFYEYNSRPYMFQARLGLQNMSQFGSADVVCWESNPPDPTLPPRPRSCAVSRAARSVLDYLAAKFALSSNGLRRAAPFRRQAPRRDYTRLFGNMSDEMTWRYLVHTHGSQIFWTYRYGRADWGSPPNMQHAILGAYPVVESYRLPSLITDFMADDQQQYFQRFYFDRDGYRGVEIYYREPRYLLSAGGIHDNGRLGLFTSAEDGWAKPTTLMPTPDGLDIQQFVRIKGNSSDDDRVNTCLAPGFACGENPEIPRGVPAPCIRTKDHWTFLDFNGTSPGCDVKYGYYVVVYSRPCDGDCDGAFGFFAVEDADGVEQLATKVLADNGNWDYKAKKINIYRSASLSGRTYKFQPVTSDRLKWGMVDMADSGRVTWFEQDMKKWPLADGEIMRSERHSGCVIIDNARLRQRLVLDLSDSNHPKRTRVWTPTECGCPLPESCLPPRYE